MQKKYINVPSVTFALKSEKLLRSHQIVANVIKTPSKFSRCGCGYSVVVDIPDALRAAEILNAYAIPVNSIETLEE